MTGHSHAAKLLVARDYHSTLQPATLAVERAQTAIEMRVTYRNETISRLLKSVWLPAAALPRHAFRDTWEQLMFDIDREIGRAPAYLDRTAARSGARQRSGAITTFMLLIALAVAAIALSPTTAQLCAKLDDFPCGP